MSLFSVGVIYRLKPATQCDFSLLKKKKKRGLVFQKFPWETSKRAFNVCKIIAENKGLFPSLRSSQSIKKYVYDTISR